MTQSVLIGSMRRSGGTLLTRLLDGHPECNVVPFEHNYLAKKLVFNRRDNRWFPFYGAARKVRVCGFEGNFDRKLGKAHPGADTAEFHSRLLELARSARSVSGFYLPSALLYFEVFQHQAPRRFLFNHSPNLCVMPKRELLRTFGPHRMILTIRDPRAVYCSLENKRNKKYDASVIPKFCREWAHSVESLHFSAPEVISFRFEDLVRKPEVVMSDVARSVGIRFDEVLLEPTIVGEPIRANSSFSRNAGIDTSAIDSWRSRLGEAERVAIEGRLRPLMDRLGYD